MDLGFEGSKFTWSKHFDSGVSIWERLDRCVVNNSWFMRFRGSRVYHLSCTSTDHIPIFISLSGLNSPIWKKNFRFEQMWLSNLSCEEVVVLAWGSGSDGSLVGNILSKVEKCGKELGQWEKNVFGNIRMELNRLKKSLAKEERVAMVSRNNFRVRQIKKEIEVLQDREATMWAQRSRILWANEGEKNSKYFHCCATRRFWKNSLEGIRDEGGVWRTRQEKIGEVMVNYFKSLFTASEGIVSIGAFDYVPIVIDEEMNGSLSREFEASEVAIALQQMAPLKAPGLDGMPLLFYQHFWSTINQDVTSSILSWLNSGTIPATLNHTFITLVSKLNSPEFPHQFRPISLCNVHYKIYSKVLANRLKKILPSIITKHQSAFTKGN